MFYVCMTLSKYLKQQNCEATFNTNYLKKRITFATARIHIIILSYTY